MGHVTRTAEIRNAYKCLFGRAEGKRPLGKTRRGWEEKLKMDLQEVGWECVDWIDLAQNRDRWLVPVYTVMNLRVL
jgi:hypothetical protein